MRTPHIHVYTGLPDGLGGEMMTILLDWVLHILPVVLLFLALHASRPVSKGEDYSIIARRLRRGIHYAGALFFSGVALWLTEPMVERVGCIVSSPDPNSGVGWLWSCSVVAAIFLWQGLARIKALSNIAATGGVVDASGVSRVRAYRCFVAFLLLWVTPAVLLFTLFTMLQMDIINPPSLDGMPMDDVYRDLDLQGGADFVALPTVPPEVEIVDLSCTIGNGKTKASIKLMNQGHGIDNARITIEVGDGQHIVAKVNPEEWNAWESAQVVAWGPVPGKGKGKCAIVSIEDQNGQAVKWSRHARPPH